MEYQALYRKWRPKTFDDVVGQSHITDTIKNEIKNGNCSHAFLFCGSRGTGKTSTARILSRAVNCENPDQGNPCNKCATCLGIENGSIMDIIEIDAASNSGVDNIRSLRDEANYSAASAKYKVYIIDEVHALSQGAFNALLKLLEEPPAHVKFVLATTEANKVLETISSRCQRFDFKRITPEDIYQRLDYICSAEGIMAEESALRMISTAADGSLRDALSFLEPCIAAGKEVDTDFVAEFLGRADNSQAIELCRAISSNDTQAVLDCIETVCSRGKNLLPFIETVLRVMRDILVISVTGKCKSDFHDDYTLLEEISASFSSEKLLYSIKTLSEASSTAKFMTNPRIIYETALIKLCIKNNDGSTDALLSRIGELERKLESGVSPVKKSVQKEIVKEKKEKEPQKAEKPKNVVPDSEVLNKIKEIWPEVRSDLSDSVMLFTALENVSLREENGRLALTFPDNGGKELRELVKDGLGRIKDAVKHHADIDIEVVTRLESDFDLTSAGTVNKDDPFEDIINLPITTIE